MVGKKILRQITAEKRTWWLNEDRWSFFNELNKAAKKYFAFLQKKTFLSFETKDPLELNN